MVFTEQGVLYRISETEQITHRFRKRDFVLLTKDNPNYPQFVEFQLTGDRCEQIEKLHIGDEVTVDFSIRGREWTSPKGEIKYFLSLEVWSIVPLFSGLPEKEELPELPLDRGEGPFG